MSDDGDVAEGRRAVKLKRVRNGEVGPADVASALDVVGYRGGKSCCLE